MEYIPLFHGVRCREPVFKLVRLHKLRAAQSTAYATARPPVTDDEIARSALREGTFKILTALPERC